MNFHGCDFLTACEEHAQLMMGEVMSVIYQSGLVGCGKCGETFRLQANAIKMWKI